jgi:caffeoyl-CoA O-methyltransferase
VTRNIRFLDPAVAAYATDHSTSPDRVQRQLIRTTAQLGSQANMQIGALQGAFMSVLTTAVRPELAVEIGTFTGYSALAVARALPAEGRLICCDRSEEWTDIGRAAWKEAGVSDRIEVRIGPALDTLRAFPDEMSIDLAFIDADKTEYIDYFEELVPRLSARGLILVDNVLWDGNVIDDTDQSESTVALRRFNEHVRDDPRVEVALLPVGDGVSVIGLAGPPLAD